MGILKPVLMLAILSSVMVCNNAWATEPPPRVGATRAEVPPKPAAAPQTPKKKPAKRRSARQVPYDVAPIPSPQVYGPRVGLPPPGAAPLPSPLILNGCPHGACTDATGARYHGGVGTTLLSPEGRVCSNNGMTVQCF